MATIEDLKRHIDIHDLAGRLGLERPDKTGNYRSPHHPDKAPSLQIGGKKYPDGFYDHSSGQGGDCIDLAKYCLGLDTAGAIRWLSDQYGLKDAPKDGGIPREKTLVEFIADQSRRNPDPAREYLAGRGIAPDVIDRAIRSGSVGYNDWTSPSKPAGSLGHGGPASVFIVKTANPGRIVAVDLRYHAPALNGDVKTKSQGEKVGYPWVSDWSAVQRAHTVLIVESAINALSAETAIEKAAFLTGWAALATRGTQTIEGGDWRWLRGKRVVVCMDNDPPDRHGKCPGREAAWKLHERLTADNIACHLVDQDDWAVNDLNDLLQAGPLGDVARALNRWEPWAIPGVPGKMKKGRARVFLPSADQNAYYLFRVREDFSSLAEISEDAEGNEQTKTKDMCSFRLAGVSKVTVASSISTMTGDADHQPTVLFAVTAQTAYHGHELIRAVTTYEKMNQPEWWRKLGTVWLPAQFMRLVNIWGRATHLGQRDAVNFVGLCYKNGNLRVNEGADCYFTNPEQQCPYHNLAFPSGDSRHAATVMRAYAQTLSHNAGLQLLVWGLGGSLKVLLSFWPHLTLQARKGSGKSTVLERLSRSIGFTMFSGQSLQTEFRLVTSISSTSHPVGWEELSGRRVEIIDRAVALLQESYKFTINRRGSDLTEFLLCAPVLLAGEDVPVRSLLGKVVRVQIRDKGPLMPPDLPAFPVRQWLDYLAKLDPAKTLAMHDAAVAYCQKFCRAPTHDDGAQRMVRNYAAVLIAWKLLLDFSGLHEAEFNFVPSLIEEMNSHIAETGAEREPWVWILEVIMNEIAAKAFPYPWRVDTLNGEEVLYLRTAHVMHHLATKSGLKPIYDGLPVKSDRVFKKQLKESGVVLSDRADPTINGQRVGHMVALSLSKLAEYGLYLSESHYPEG